LVRRRLVVHVKSHAHFDGGDTVSKGLVGDSLRRRWREEDKGTPSPLLPAHRPYPQPPPPVHVRTVSDMLRGVFACWLCLTGDRRSDIALFQILGQTYQISHPVWTSSCEKSPTRRTHSGRLERTAQVTTTGLLLPCILAATVAMLPVVLESL
jgi:hypothetical protein